jgi:TPR repeat protein
MRAFLLLVILLLPACVPYTSVPMVALMGYDSAGKRQRLEEYAARGDVYAMYDLAESYRHHAYEGGIKPEKAVEWYCKAGRGGYGKAQYELGLLYEGKSDIAVDLSPDMARAYMWYTLAARRVHQGAIIAQQRLKDALPDKEVALGEMWLTEWKLVPCGVDEKDKPLPKGKPLKKKSSKKTKS